MRRGVLWLLGIAFALLAPAIFPETVQPPESLKLVVWLRPAPPGVVPLEPGQPTLYTFEVFGFDEAHKQTGISDQVFVHEGRRREVHKKGHGLELTGMVDLGNGEARYQVKLLARGRQVAATAASMALETGR